MRIRFETPGRGKSHIFEQMFSGMPNWGDVLRNHISDTVPGEFHTCHKCNSVFTSTQLEVNDLKCLKCKTKMFK